MTIADKLLYLGETKDRLADAINSYTQVITPDTPFREYAQWIDNIVFSAEGGIPSLFDGEAGFLWGDLPYYQDLAGTTEATWGDPVGLIPDASGNGADFTQATVTARPVLGRVPKGGRRNLLLNTGLLSDTYWNKQRVTTTVSDTPSPIDGNMMVLVQETVESGVHYLGRFDPPVLPEGTPDCKSIYVAAAGRRRVMLSQTGPSGISSWAIYDLVEGIVVSAHETVTPSIEYVASNIYRISNYKFNSDSTRPFALYIVPDTATSYDGRMYEGDGVSGVLLYAPQLEEGTAVTPYQSVTSNYDITESGVPEVHYLGFDGTDDLVSAALPAITDGTLVIAGTNGIWIDDDFNHAGGAFSVGPTTYTGGPAGILPIVGDLIVGGSFAIDRQLTTQERERVINKLKSMGAPGVFELGEELVTNGDFSSPEGWVFSGPQSAGASISGGTLNFDGSSTGYSSQEVQQDTLAAAGEKLLLRYQAVSVSASIFRINMGHRGATPGPSRSAPGTYADIVSPSGSVPGRLNIQTGTGFVGSLDNVSLRKLELVP